MNKLFIDLFAGCGGLSLGLKQAGFTPTFMNDIDKTCCDTYQKNHALDRSQVFAGDIKDLNRSFNDFNSFFGGVDLVCGGPPCQGFSMANRQRIIDDPRNILYKEFLFFLQKTNPKFFIIENVKGMSNKIDEILQDIRQILGEKYNTYYSLLNASDFGVPQNRERFFIIGNRIGVNSKDIFEDILSDQYPSFILKDAIDDLPPLKPNRIKNNTSIENYECGFKKRKFEYEKTDFYKFINGDRLITYLYNHKNRYNNHRDIEIFNRLPQGANSLHPSIKSIMPYKSRSHIFKDKYYKLDYSRVCKTITAHMKFDCNMYIHPTQARGLSPREAARIQTFPDDFIFLGAQNYWYHQIGNAVPVKLAEAIGRKIIQWL